MTIPREVELVRVEEETFGKQICITLVKFRQWYISLLNKLLIVCFEDNMETGV